MEVNFDGSTHFTIPSNILLFSKTHPFTEVKWVANAVSCQGNGLSLCAHVRHPCAGTKADPLGKLEGKKQ